MKKINLILLAIIAMASCKKENEFVKLSGKINSPKDSILVVTGENILKEIKINKDGTFKDTLKIHKKGHYRLTLGSNKRAIIYLKNGYDLILNAEDDPFFESFTYKGKGSDTNNFILSQFELSRNYGDPSSLYLLEKNAFDNKVRFIKKYIDSVNTLYGSKNIDTAVYNSSNRMSKQYLENITKDYERNHDFALKQKEIMEKTAIGRPSPKFEDYVDFKGGKKSLDAFRGKYVYLDIWATWCGPCIQQIPYLKDLEKEYHNKNIEFVSISTDEARKNGGSWEAAEKKWRNFVKERQLTGTQLWSGKDYSFQQAYQITGIPRFILIDPQGNIVDANAPRPSDPRIKQLFTSLGI